jgi:hypothetical protein
MDKEGRVNDKDELKRRMEETRQSMTETVGEIKQELADALEWRTYLRRYPGRFLIGAATAGFFLGRALKPDGHDREDYHRGRDWDDRLASGGGVEYATGDSYSRPRASEPEHGDSVLKRAGEVVATTVIAQLAPIVSTKLRQLFGVGPSHDRESSRPGSAWTH